MHVFCISLAGPQLAWLPFWGLGKVYKKCVNIFWTTLVSKTSQKHCRNVAKIYNRNKNLFDNFVQQHSIKTHIGTCTYRHSRYQLISKIEHTTKQQFLYIGFYRNFELCTKKNPETEVADN